MFKGRDTLVQNSRMRTLYVDERLANFDDFRWTHRTNFCFYCFVFCSKTIVITFLFLQHVAVFGEFS